MAAQYGPHRWSAGYHADDQPDAFRGAKFTVTDLSGARFVDCDLSQVKIVDSWLVGAVPDEDVLGRVIGRVWPWRWLNRLLRRCTSLR